ncbi:MAG: nucleoside triphosphate pyrophosphohydrolase [Myxococcales bacterium]
MTEVPTDQVARLVAIMARLRGDGGCPWDRAQDHRTLVQYLIEETYEVVDAIEALTPEGDGSHLCEELGDLLLQVVFHAQIESERGAFDLQAVARAISDKMERRHPHVFGDEAASTAEEVRDRWAELKKEEGRRTLTGVPRHLPPLLRAWRVTEKAAAVGFDWPSPLDVLDKVEEEIQELRAALVSGERGAVRHELGDLLFTMANLGRHLDVDPDDALRATIDRFVHRFEHIEDALVARALTPGEVSLAELDRLWEEAKAAER